MWLRSGMAEEREDLIADPFGRGHPAGPEMVFPANDDVLGRRGARGLALRRRHEADTQGFSQVADPVKESRRVRRAIELETGEVVVVHPLMEERLEEDLRRQDLLPDRRQVVDPDRPAPWRRLPGDPVVAVRF